MLIRPPQAGPPAVRKARHAARETAARAQWRVSGVAVSAATGVAMAAAADTAGRLGHAGAPWADALYWLGQAMVLVPVSARLLSRRVVAAAETVALIVILTVAEYLIRICYSPAAFTYPDELEHWRSTVDVLQTGHLFTANDLLPISPHFPGLEVVTSALASVTGLSVFHAGLVIAGAAHLLFVGVLFALFTEIIGHYRIAGIAVLFYASNSLFESFDSMFVYQTMALPFLGLTVLAVARLAAAGPGRPRGPWLTLAAVAIATAVVTHHVTSYVLVAVLVLLAVAGWVTRERPLAAWATALAAAAAAAAACWLLLAAPQTWGYLEPFGREVLQGLRALLTGGQASAPPPSGPPANRALAAVSVLAVSALLPAGWWQVWRRYRGQPWAVAMTAGSVAWYAIVLVRFTVEDGSELAGRASTFVFVPVAYVAALAVGHLATAALRRGIRIAAAAALVMVLLLMFDGLANGWPPYWERLPGPHQVAGAERSVGPGEIAAARWALAALGPGNRFAADIGSYPVLGSYGDQNPLRDVAYLYTAPVFTPSAAARAQAQSLRYVLVDHRLSQSLPASGRYFPDDPRVGHYSRPLPAAGLRALNSAPGADRSYDAGSIVIYRLNGP